MRVNRWIFLGVIFLAHITASGTLAGTCSGASCGPDFVVYGFGLNPYRDGDGPGSDIEPNQVREMLRTIAPYTQWIRSYSSSHGLQEMATEANELGLNTAMGLWIRHETGREEEISNMIAKAQTGCVDMAVVGNEELYAYEEGYNNAIDPNTLKAILVDVHSRLDANGLSNIPVTIAEPWDTLFRRNPDNSFKYQEVLDELDVFMVNIYPFHRGIHIDDAVDDLNAIYRKVVADANEAGPNKSVIISETGWPSEGEREIAARPSPLNAARYFHGVQCWAARNDVNVFYFSAYDEEWKAPPEYAAHWGIWKSNGTIKPEFLPCVVFCEDFDPLFHQFCAGTNSGTGKPNVIPGDSNSDANFLRILYDGFPEHFSSAAFDRVAEGPFDKIVIQFDFRIYSARSGADGFSVLLIPTSVNGLKGCQKHGFSNFYAEQPKLSGTFGVGFRIYNSNQIYISWDRQFYPGQNPIDIPVGQIDLNSGKFHQARIEVCFIDGDTALVNVSLTPDIYDINHPASITRSVVIGDANHPCKPYESRMEFAGRNGGLTTNVDIDNINVSYSSEFCKYKQVKKCGVTAGSKPTTDAISISGNMDATADDFNNASAVKVAVDSNDMVNPCVQTFPINDQTFKKGKYKCTIINKPLKTSFAFDTRKSKFSFTAKNVSLKGLSCPVDLQIKVGDYIGATEVDEAIVNGKKPIPIKLMMGVKDSLRVDKITVKQGKKSSTDSLSAKGGIAFENLPSSMGDVVLTLTQGLASQTFKIPTGSFTPKGKSGLAYVCKNAPVTEGGIISATFDFSKCSFVISIKNTTINSQSGKAVLCLAIGSFNQCMEVDLGP